LLEHLNLSKPDSWYNSTSTAWFIARYLAGFLFVIGAGVIAWRISAPGNSDEEAPEYVASREWEIQLLGWSSAVLFREFQRR
jgi:hypothetical protein